MSTYTAFRRLMMAALLLMFLATIPSAAQGPIDTTSHSDETTFTAPDNSWRQSPLMKEFESQLAWKVLDHWTTRLNDYKSRIDRVMSPCDLAELNRLRVYWSMFLDEKKWEGLMEGVEPLFDSPASGSGTYYEGETEVQEYTYEENSQYDYEGTTGEYYTDTATAVPSYNDYAESEFSSEYATMDTVASAYEGDQPEYAAVEVEVESEDATMYYSTDTSATYQEYAVDTASYAYENYGEGEIPMEPEEEEFMTPEQTEESIAATMAVVDEISQMAETFFVAKWIARRYRPEFTRLQESMTNDFAAFLDTLIQFRDQFVSAHSAELANYPEMRNDLEQLTRGEIDNMIASMKKDKWVPLVYNVVVEPLLLLYNGQDLRKLLKEVDALPAELSGLSLPEMSALRQNTPNPASTSTSVPYVLNEPSGATVLRLYDARGEMVAVHDLGLRPAGEHQIDIDVSKLPAGSYLYHLTVQNGSGERVYSKTMQVVR